MNTPLRGSILFINNVAPEQIQALPRLEEILGRLITPILLRDAGAEEPNDLSALERLIQLEANFSDPIILEQTLAPYIDDILLVTYKDNASAAASRHVAPFLPHLMLSSAEALEAATEKAKMRPRFHAYDPQLSPRFTVAHDARPATIRRIERIIGYPLIVKPSGLTSSLLVTVCHNHDEFEAALQQVMQLAALRYRAGQGRPEVVVESFMDGGKYFSVDVYVGTNDQLWFTPLVYGKTGRDVGFDDVFGYMQATPSPLTTDQVKAAEVVAAAGIKALDLQSCTCHVELMLTADGWKLLELGPRIGGFRHELYSKAFGINHALNDLLVRMGEEPIIPTKPLGHAAFVKFFPRQEGILNRIDGLSEAESRPSVERLTVFSQTGDLCLFAGHGGSRVLEFVLFNADRAQLLADIEYIESLIFIETLDPAPTPADTQQQEQRLTVTGSL